MRSGFRKIGVIFSAAAILLTAFFLPFHYHEAHSSSSDSTHCAVCHLSQETRSTHLSPSLLSLPFQELKLILSFLTLQPDIIRVASRASPRAPPTI